MEIKKEIDAKLKKINGKTRLEKLQSYYFTWSLPKHPESKELFKLLLKLVEIKDIAEKQVTRKLRSHEIEKNIFSLDELEEILSFAAQTELDKDIANHIKMHYFILQEIRNELKDLS